MGLPTMAVFQAAVNLLSADTLTFAATGDAAPTVRLVKEPFTPSMQLTPAAMAAIEATFAGYAGIGAATGTQNTGQDPLSSDYLLQLKPPAGGFRWETGGGFTGTQTITGWYIGTSESPDTALLYSALFTTPIVLTAPNQVIEIPSVELRYLVGGVR